MAKRKKTNQPKKNSKRNQLSKLPVCDADLMPALYEAFRMARRGKLNTDDEFKFEMFWIENLYQLCEDILMRRYKPSRSKAFITHTPVTREIFAAPFRDRIVHHFLYAVVAPWWDRRFVYTSSSCRVGKGTDFAVQELQTAMRRASKNGKERAWVFKGDLSGYFMSLDRGVLYKKVMWGLKRQFPEGGWLYEVCEFLWREVIFDDPTYNVRLAGRKSDWNDLPKNKSLFNQPPGVGIVIGNLTSQLLSNIMMNDFDWFVKMKLGLKFYGRYVDDFYIVVHEDDLGYLKAVVREVLPEYLAEEGLKMHPKKIYMQPTSRGVPFLGKKIYLHAITPSRRYRKNAKKAMWDFAEGRGNIDTVASYVGMTKNLDATRFLLKIFGDLGWRYRA